MPDERLIELKLNVLQNNSLSDKRESRLRGRAHKSKNDMVKENKHYNREKWAGI